MLVSMLLPPRRSWRWTAVHPAPTVCHRRRLAGLAAAPSTMPTMACPPGVDVDVLDSDSLLPLAATFQCVQQCGVGTENLVA